MIGIYLAQPVLGQKLSKVTKEQLSRKNHPQFPDAAAVYLLNYGSININAFTDGTGQVEVTYVKRIQFYNEQGAPYAQTSIELYNSKQGSERIRNIRVQSHNLVKGKVRTTDMDRRNIKTEKINDNWSVVSFRAPKVKDQTIIDISYTVTIPFLGAAPKWFFQRDIPVENSTFFFSNYYDFPYTPHANAIDQIKVDISGRNGIGRIQRTLNAVALNLPPYKEVDYLMTPEDGIPAIRMVIEPGYLNTSILERRNASWETVGDELLRANFFGKLIKQEHEDLRTIVNRAKRLEEPEAIKQVYEDIQRRFKWNRVYEFAPYKDLKEIFQTKEGSIGEINLVLLNVLDKIGVEADPLLTKSRGDGMLQNSSPGLTDFNYLIAKVTLKTGEILLLDASSKITPFGQLPHRAANEAGLLVVPSASRLVGIPSANNFVVNNTMNLVLNPENFTLTGYGKRLYRDYAATYHKIKVHNKFADEDIRNIVVVEPTQVSARDNYRITSSEDKSENEVVLDLNYTMRDPVESSGDSIYIAAALNFGLNENPCTDPSRGLPFFYSHKTSLNYVAQVKIPEGYELKEFPGSAAYTLSDNGAKFNYDVNKTESGFSIVYRLQINKTSFSKTEYPDLREFFNRVISKENEKISLVRSVSQ